ncbi:uncharacterized protein LODBEIA_P17180 [Lodderomyces beijingensis]|uniref:Shugoshin C-terminal domain-containing protein n=1 Tax=Lodderomyces beijingensis TaxID=1775926 RepID=A0ABP0ZH58_9ASCO
MVNQRLVDEHYERREAIQQVLQDDKNRINSLVLAIFRVMILKQHNQLSVKKSPRSSPRKIKKKPVEDDVGGGGEDEEKAKNDFEIQVSKLKQEHSTKSKLAEAKLQTLKTENDRLKSQIKKLNAAKIKSTSNGSLFSSSRRALSSRSRSIFTPDKFKSRFSSSLFSNGFPALFDDDLMTPIRKSTGNGNENGNENDEDDVDGEENDVEIVEEKSRRSLLDFSPTSNQKERKTSGASTVLSKVPEDGEPLPLSIPKLRKTFDATSSSPTRERQARTPSRVIDNFDDENVGGDNRENSRSRSLSPEFTPNRISRSASTQVPNPILATGVATASTEDSPTSKKSRPLENASEDHEMVKKKKTVASRNPSASSIKFDKMTGLHSDDSEDELNQLAKYEDANFEDDEPDNSQNTILTKRKNKSTTETSELMWDVQPKKKRNVFTID